MAGRYELVAVDYCNKGKVIQSKNGGKLSLAEADIFTGLFNNKEELNYYLFKKEYIDFNVKKFVLLYYVNKKSRYFDCLYKEDRDLISLAHLFKKNKKVSTNNSLLNYLVSYLVKNNNDDFIEYAYSHKYINKYLYEKLLEYRYGNNKLIIKNIINELSKEYLQIRKIYELKKNYNKNIVDKKVIGSSDDPYIQYLIDKANNNDENAYEELRLLDLEKTMNLKM